MEMQKQKQMKVKFIVFWTVYILIITTSLLIMIATQNGNGVAALIVVGLVGILLLYSLIKAAQWVIINWNLKINL